MARHSDITLRERPHFRVDAPTTTLQPQQLRLVKCCCGGVLRAALQGLACFIVFLGFAHAQPAPPYVFNGPVLPLLLQMPANGWLKLNVNRFSDVWTSPDLEPLNNGQTALPSAIIAAWSGFAWDRNRGDLILYGGGHANYPGNDVYRWHSSTLQWERASLPSEIRFDPIAGYQAIDGVDNAPSSAHTYKNNTFLPIVDRFLTWGGAAYNNGGPYLRVSETNPTTTRITGPYLFDPNRADGNKVGGTTGSHVKRVAPHPEIVGGQMWQNRDLAKNLAGQSMPGLHRDGCAAYTSENGFDVVYVGASNQFSTNLELYRYQLTNVANPAGDQIAKVGMYFNGAVGTTTCAYDASRKLFLRTNNNNVPFLFWDLASAGPFNADHVVQINSSIASLQTWLAAQALDVNDCGLEFDPVRGTFPLWCGGTTIWELHAPAAGNTEAGWSAVQRLSPSSSALPTPDNGVVGKWRYAPYYDVFVALENNNDGNVWVYKPSGWVQPNPSGNALPTVAVTSPANGSSYAPGTAVTLTATASDPGGSIARIEYYANGDKVGQSTIAPYTVTINPILVGAYKIIAVAVDNVGGMAQSAPVTFSVIANLSTTVLQRGLAGYALASDTFLDNLGRTTVRGNFNPLYLDAGNYTPLLRFAIFASEGGPVPNGAVIQSATLSLYKQSYDSTLRLNALLVPWVESQATWSQRTTGVSWNVGGAAGVGTDYNSAADALINVDYDPGWITFDVAARVQQWSNGGGNYGWRLSQTDGNANPKTFNSSEYSSSTLRPKLTVVYSSGTANTPPTVTLTSPAGGASITLGASFTLTANASDSDGSINRVEFFANGISVGQLTSAPYSLSWTPAVAGSYTLTAVATDNLGAPTTSVAVTVGVVTVSVNPGHVLLTDANWTVTHTGDFNGDGRADLVWHNAATGATAIWLMNGTTYLSGAIVLTDPNWTVTHVVDLDGGGRSDLVWRNAATGRTALWLMNGTSYAGGAIVMTNAVWSVVKTGDFDGDGRGDLVWRNASTGETAIWLMNGLAFGSGAIVSNAAAMSVTNVGDYNGDGGSDLVWRNANTGDTSMWLMNGAAPLSQRATR